MVRFTMISPRLPIAICFFVSAFFLISCGEDAVSNTDEFPRKPIKIVVPFGPGGDSDTFARIMQKAIRDHDLLPQPLVILNVPGAGGTIGSRRVRDAAPDGYTILNLHEGILTSKYAGRVSYGPEAFQPIAATAMSNLVICVREDSPHKDLRDLLKAAAEKPDLILFGMAQGTPTHFAGRRLEKAGAGVQFRMVDSGGGSKRRNDLVGKHIDATPFSLAEYIGFEGGGVRAIAYLAAERHPELPEVPTALEFGYAVVMPHVHYWWAPKSTPDEAVERIADVLEAAMETEYMRGKLAETKTEALFLRGAELEAHLADREGEFQDVALVNYQGLPNLVVPILVIVIALGTSIGIRGFIGRGAVEKTPAVWRHGVLSCAVLAVYVVSMQVFGIPYLFATMAFVPALAVVVGARSMQSVARVTVLGIALACGCFFIFTKVLVIDLP
ncbi:MAG: tripartite-type tricarboxylate transporter receptor subunit TctC [Pseudoalteromonas tetraodonis]|jgi:tripartite-type tricarboxylate transporter receptor subunit TctC